MMTRVYIRCNSGHYFQGEFCPFDGWSSPASRELAAAVNWFAESGRKVTLQGLQKAGMSEAAIRRTIVIEFGSSSSAFEALSPEYYVVDGKAIPLRDLDENFT
jgi:hypothetical protein